MTAVASEAAAGPAGHNRAPLLSLDESLGLDISAANKLYADHLNKYLLQVFDVLGFGDMDIEGAQGIEPFSSAGSRVSCTKRTTS